MSIGSIFLGIVVLTLIASLILPLTIQYGTNQTANTLSGIAGNSSSQLQNNFYNPIASTAYSSNGFGANIQQFTGLAFIYAGFLGFAQTIANVGPLMSFIIGQNIAIISLGDVSGVNILGITNLFVTLILLFLATVFISYWGKYNLWSST